MDETKNLLQSKTVWGAVLAFVGVVMNAMGFETEALQGLDGDLVTIVGAALAIYGRIKAVKKIG